MADATVHVSYDGPNSGSLSGVTGSDGTIKRVNKATSHLLGYEEQELVGTTIDFVVNTRKSG